VRTYDPFERARQARRQAASVAAVVGIGLLAVIVVAGLLWTRRGVEAANPKTAVRQTGGPDLTWQPFRAGVDLPVSQSGGPFRQIEGLAAGFSQSQLGAAMAAIHIGTRIDATNGPRVFENTIREQVVGTDAGQLRKHVNDIYQDQRVKQGKGLAEPLAPTAPVLYGYRVESLAPESASVSVFYQQQNLDPQYYSVRFDLRWVDSDWRLVAPPGGVFDGVLTRLTALPAGAVVLTRGN
jgi:hypothetical protein